MDREAGGAADLLRGESVVLEAGVRKNHYGHSRAVYRRLSLAPGRSGVCHGVRCGSEAATLSGSGMGNRHLRVRVGMAELKAKAPTIARDSQALMAMDGI